MQIRAHLTVFSPYKLLSPVYWKHTLRKHIIILRFICSVISSAEGKNTAKWCLFITPFFLQHTFQVCFVFGHPKLKNASVI